MSPRMSAVIGVLFVAVLVLLGVALLHSGTYGFTIFVLVPVFLGGLASWIVRPTSGGRAAKLGALATIAAVCSLLVLGLEGLLCIIMALPLSAALGAFGGWLVYRAESSRLATRGVTLLLLLPPASLTWDVEARPPLFEVRTAIEIAATPEQVWKHVVTFSDLPEPHEWFFRAGLSYPQRARIVGTGVGAVRYCEFSTGPFVEPIEVWNEPILLRFRVTQNPPPLRELTPYAHLEPRHLHGYLISREGQFRLTPLPNHHTRLEGTTWYQHSLWPAEYWRWWSDWIIHRIHLRVLGHIRVLAEQESQ